jgi:iron-only hydrogenase group A
MTTEQTKTKNYIKIKVNGTSVKVPQDIRLIDAIRDFAHSNIPGICYKKGVDKNHDCVPGSCRSCQVQIEKKPGKWVTMTACEQFVKRGMNVRTNSPEILVGQQNALKVIAQNHPGQCLGCQGNGTCMLQEQVARLNVEGNKSASSTSNYKKIETPSIVFDQALCINCGRCGFVCPTGAMGRVGRGVTRYFGPLPDVDFSKACVNCGQCTKVCPVGALTEKTNIAEVETALMNPDIHVFFQIAPAVRVAIGETLGIKEGTPVTGKLYAALRKLGSNVTIGDTNVSADLTIMEEGTELIERIKNGGKLPMITSCCPGWIKYAETFYPKILDHLSTCKSPQQMLGALAKTYYAKEAKIDPKNIVSVSVMPCTAKKFEAERPEMNDSGYQDIDYVLTTRELIKMIQSRGIDFSKLHNENADYPFEEYTGAGTIFGNTGGVMEAALRTVYKVVTGKELEGIEFAPVRGMKELKEADVELGSTKIKVAVLHNLNNEYIPQILEDIIKGTSPYTFIEIMACPGGCIGGGGQPKEFNPELKAKRTEGLYKDDRKQRFRRSHESPVVKRIYDDFIGHPNSEKAHKMLHTKYTERSLV